MRRSILFIGFAILHIILIVIMLLHSHFSQSVADSEHIEQARLVKTLRLTDLCLFTEARYTRHPAMADKFAPFQDHPTALEHFPSGSFVTSPTLRPHERTP